MKTTTKRRPKMTKEQKAEFQRLCAISERAFNVYTSALVAKDSDLFALWNELQAARKAVRAYRESATV